MKAEATPRTDALEHAINHRGGRYVSVKDLKDALSLARELERELVVASRDATPHSYRANVKP